ncbi:MAG: hypothetical protein ABH858_07185, partial [Candidatus Omnitrophota bacterium]
MFKRILNRFEKLENLSADADIKHGLRISRRFERLEIGDKKIEFSLIDKITSEETAQATINYFIICPYCGMENAAEVDSCSFCKHNLKTKFAEDFQERSRLLKRCVCGTMNQADKLNCWACGVALKAADERKVKKAKNSDNIIILNIDGKEYKSTDSNLPSDIRDLINQIRKEGYKKELIDEWVKSRKINEADHLTRINAR